MDDFLSDARRFVPILLDGVTYTILTTIGSLVLSTAIGLLWALMRWSKVAPLSLASQTIVTVIRGIPMIVQLFYIYFVLPDIGIDLTAFHAGIIGLAIGYSAYQAENFRAGIEAIDHGQIEAAQSMGMGDWLIMRRVTLPQAIRIILPPYGNIMIMMLKDSSLVSTITVAELTRQGQLIAASTFKNMTVYTLVAIMYLVMSLPLTYLARRLEKTFAQK